jgi:putative sugar O-methyltransferase
MIRSQFQERIEAARQSAGFRNYSEVRERVLDMLDEAHEEQLDAPSDYWEEELEGFDYILDASPLVISKLREHCYHLTGLRSNEYRRHHTHRRQLFATKLRALHARDTDNLLVPESPALGGFGFEINGRLINLDTLKYYECLIAMNHAGLLKDFRARGERRRVALEIGGGWGALAYQFKTLFPETCYVIVDLPQTLIFSATYLRTLFPESRTFIYGDDGVRGLPQEYESYDFIFLPHFAFPRSPLAGLELAINTVSFQEMTSGQVEAYVRKLAELGCRHLYSLNRDRSPHNAQLSAVSDILKGYYRLEEVSVLEVPYTTLSSPEGDGVKGRAKVFARKLLSARHTQPVFQYRHLVGSLAMAASEKAQETV